MATHTLVRKNTVARASRFYLSLRGSFRYSVITGLFEVTVIICLVAGSQLYSSGSLTAAKLYTNLIHELVPLALLWRGRCRTVLEWTKKRKQKMSQSRSQEVKISNIITQKVCLSLFECHLFRSHFRGITLELTIFYQRGQ